MEQGLKLEQQLCFEVYKASSNFTKMYTRVLEPFGLTFTQYLVLLVLWEDDHILMKDIGLRLGLGTGTLNPIINRMIAQGRLTKTQSPDDKRAWIVSLTQTAKTDHEPISQAVHDKLVSCSSPDVDAVELMKNLKSLNAFFGEMNF